LREKRFQEIATTAVSIESRTNLLFSFEKMAIRDAIKPWAERLRDRRFETEGEWKLKLAGGTRGTVELLARELRDALR